MLLHYLVKYLCSKNRFATRCRPVSVCPGDSDVISMPAGFRRHLVGKTLMNVIHCDIAEIRFFG